MTAEKISIKETSIGARRRRGQAGFAGLTDVLLGLAVIGMVMPTLVGLINQQAAEAQDQAAAVQLKAVREAAVAFVKNSYDGIYANIAAGSDSLAVADLIDAGYLPPGFKASNNFGQTPVILLRQLAQGLPGSLCAALPPPPPANNGPDCKKLIEALIVTVGGKALDPAEASHVAVLSGAHGGVIVDAGTARGAYGSWCVNLDKFGGAATGSCTAVDSRASVGAPLAGGGITAPAKGGLAAALFFSGGVLMNEYLDRFKTGDPEDNTMHTDLNMGGNSVTSVKTVIVNGVTVQSDGAGTLSLTQVAGGAVVDANFKAGAVTAASATVAGNATVGGTVTAAQFAYPP